MTPRRPAHGHAKLTLPPSRASLSYSKPLSGINVEDIRGGAVKINSHDGSVGRVHPTFAGSRSRSHSLPSHDVEPVTAMNRGVAWKKEEEGGRIGRVPIR